MDHDGGVRTRTELAGEPRSVPLARRAVVTALREDGLEHLVPSAALLVSELATNAVLHARSGFALEVTRGDAVVRVSLSDGSPQGPARRRHGVAASTGRGIGLVAVLATDWGTEPAGAPWAKTVWFELPLDPALLPDPDEGALLV